MSIFQRKAYFIAIFWVCFTCYSQAQKIKYKDVFPLLTPKQTEEGVALLRQFLQDEKNQDEANANYQLGEYYYLTYKGVDVLNDTVSMFAFGDSAVAYYQKALPLITEKELKKNDAYYQSFYRRDLRTGEFGIKISDVKLDLENKIREIGDRNASVLAIHQMLQSMNSTHEATVKTYNNIIGQFSSFESYLFQLDQKQLQQLSALTEYQYQLFEKSKQLTELFEEITVTSPFSELESTEVPLFEEINPVFLPYALKYEVWNMEQWVDKVNQVYRTDIEEYKLGLIRWDKSLNLGRERISNGSTAKISTQPADHIAELLLKYDERAAMSNYLEMKANMLILESLTDTLMNPQWLDSTDVQLNVGLSDSVINLIETLEPRFDGLEESIKLDANIYEEHIDELYGGVSAITSTIKKWQKNLGGQKAIWEQHRNFWSERNRLVAWEGLTINIDTMSAIDTASFVSIARADMLEDVNVLLQQTKDSSLHVLQTGPDRVARWLTDTGLKSKPNQRHLWLPSQVGFVSLLMTQRVDSVDLLSVMKLSPTGEKLWQSSVPDVPSVHHVNWDEVIDQYTIYFLAEDQYPLSDGSNGYVIIDKDGQVK